MIHLINFYPTLCHFKQIFIVRTKTQIEMDNNVTILSLEQIMRRIPYQRFVYSEMDQLELWNALSRTIDTVLTLTRI